MEFKGPVLIAEIPEAMAEIARCFPKAQKRCVTTLDEATQALESARFELIVIGFHFNQARIFELLGQIRGLERCRGVPIVCVRLRPLPLSDDVRESIRNAVLVLGGTAFVDVSHVSADTFCTELERRRPRDAATSR